MEPEPTNDQTLVTAGQLAKSLGRSSYGVKKAILRLGIAPKRILNMVSYYDPLIEDPLRKAMRGPNLQTTQS